MTDAIEAGLVQFLAKSSLVLGVVWMAQFVLSRCNPRWRIGLWRIAAVGIAFVLFGLLAPPLYEVPWLPPNETAVSVVTTPSKPVDVLAASVASINQSDEVDRSHPRRERAATDDSISLRDAKTSPRFAERPMVASIAENHSEPERVPADDARIAEREPASFDGRLASLAVYSLVAGWLIAKVLLGLFMLGRERHMSTPSPDWVRQLASELPLEYRIPPDRVRITTRFESPVIGGLLRPVILLPESMLSSPTAVRDVKGALAHEAAHAAGGDLPWDVFLAVVSAVIWPNPLAWRIRSAHRADCEQVSDRFAADFIGDVAAYRSLLANMALRVSSIESQVGLAMARRSEVRMRLESLIRIPHSPHLGRRGLLPGLCVLCGVVLVSLGSMVAAPAASNRAAEPMIVHSIDPTIGREVPEESEAARSRLVAANEPAAADDDDKADKGEKAPTEKLAGRVVDEVGNPVPHVEIILENYADKLPTVMTDADGRFELTVAADAWKWRSLAARANGGRQLGTVQLPAEPAKGELQKLSITLAPARQTIIRVVDGKAQPVPEASVGIIADYRDVGVATTDQSGSATVFVPKGAEIQQAYAMKNGIGLDYKSYVLPRDQRNDRITKKPEIPADGVILILDGVQPLTVTMLARDGMPIPDMRIYPWLFEKPGESDHLNLSTLTRRKEFVLKTDANGAVAIRFVPQWQKGVVTIWPNSKDYDSQRGNYDPAKGNGTLEMRLNRLVPMRGKVVFSDGSPAAGITIDVAGAGYSHDGFRETITSKADGSFEVKAAPNQVYLLVVKDRRWAAEPLTGFPLLPDQPLNDLTLRLRLGTKIHGRITIGSERKPVSGFRITSYQYGADAHNMKGVALPNPEQSTSWVCPVAFHHAVTDADGRYEFFVGPGSFDIRGPNQSKVEKFEVKTEPEKTFDFHMPREEKGILKGLVVAGDPPRPVAGAKVSGIAHYELSGRDLEAVTNAEGRFEVERILHPTAIHAISADQTLGALLEIDADATEITISLKPMASAKGTVIDGITRTPVAGAELVYGVDVHLGDKSSPFRTSWGGTVRTDDNGKFEIRRLNLGGDYKISLTLAKGRSWRQIATIKATEPVVIDLGTILSTPDANDRPAALAERIAAAFTHQLTPLERFAAAIADAKLSRQRVMVLFAIPDSNAARQLMTLRFEDDEIRSAFDEFRLIPVDPMPPNLDPARLLAEKFDRDLQGPRSTFFVVVADADGKLIDSAEVGVLMQGGRISRDKLKAFLQKNRQAP